MQQRAPVPDRFFNSSPEGLLEGMFGCIIAPRVSLYQC